MLLKTDKGLVPFPTSLNNNDDAGISMFYDCCWPISTELLAANFKSVLGYYLVGINTFTMFLFH